MRIAHVLTLAALIAAPAGCQKKTAEPSAPAATTGAQPQPKAPATPGLRGTFTVGPKTTVVTGPKTPSGHIDYAAALNERLSKGVTPENNANVLLWRAIGPNPDDGKVPPGYFEKLGVAAPPPGGAYFVGVRGFARQRPELPPEAAGAAMKRFSERPWKAGEDPAFADWVRANEKPLALVAEAVQRPRYYNPLIPEAAPDGSPKGLFSCLLPSVQVGREMAGALACRAILALGHGQPPAEAWKDILTVYRLGRTLGRGGTAIEGLVGYAVDQVANRAALAYLAHVRPDAVALRALDRDLRALPPHADPGDKLDLCERFGCLEAIMLLDRSGVVHFTRLPEVTPGGPPGFGDDLLAGINWNPALGSANDFYDRMAAALRDPDRARARRALAQIDTDLLRVKVEVVSGPSSAVLKSPGSPAADRGLAVGHLLLTQYPPAADKIRDAADRARQAFENVLTAVACERYRRATGRYPAQLDDLAPTYLPSAPRDLFSGAPLIYTPTTAGYRFHSVGPNGRDDGGRFDLPKDDIAVEVPPRGP